MSNDQNTQFSQLLDTLGLKIPQLYMPCTAVDLYRWAVIACDQHTTDAAFWEETKSVVGDSHSTYHMILPEIYLEQEDETSITKRISQINHYMTQADEKHLVCPLADGCMLIDRKTPYHDSRIGLVIAVDLEQYDFKSGTSQLIRASEGTVLERIPPRAAVRRDALFELPHVQLLFDDPDHAVLGPLFTHLKQTGSTPYYKTRLMQKGGHVTGWFLESSNGYLQQALKKLADLESLSSHHLLFAVGDGNHSLATAKAHWDSIRDKVSADHPARYALVEIINIHDKGLDFEPIHRIIFDFPADELLAEARQYFKSALTVSDKQNKTLTIPESQPGQSSFTLVSQDAVYPLHVSVDNQTIPADTVQTWLDHLIKSRNIKIDYVHGLDAVDKLTALGHSGLLLPELSKHDFFPVLAAKGVLPRKTFSMGAASEKRYYLEARKIRLAVVL